MQSSKIYCAKCNMDKDKEHFYFKNSYDPESGPMKPCKQCRKVNAKKYKKENPDKVKQYNNTYYQAVKKRKLHES